MKCNIVNLKIIWNSKYISKKINKDVTGIAYIKVTRGLRENILLIDK